MEKVSGILVTPLLGILKLLIHNSPPSHTDNCKNDFLLLCEGDILVLMKLWCTQKKCSINFSKAKSKFCLSLPCNGDNSYLFVNGKKICMSKANNEYVNFQFCLGIISKKFDYIEVEEVF